MRESSRAVAFAASSDCLRSRSAASIRSSASPACCSASSASCLRLAVRLLGRGARGLRGLVGQTPGLGQLLGRLRDELLGALAGLLGLALGLLELLVDLRLGLLALLLGLGLGLFALAPHGLVGGLLRLGHTLLDLPGGLALDLGHACAAASLT